MKALTSRQFYVYEFMKENCVGKINKMQGKDIVQHLIDEGKAKSDYNTVSLKGDIKQLRTSDMITRKIGSTSSGYWLMLADEDGLEYIKKLTVSHLKTAIKQGIKAGYFHQVINEIESSDVADKQQRIPFTPYEKTEVNVFSNDLRK